MKHEIRLIYLPIKCSLLQKTLQINYIHQYFQKIEGNQNIILLQRKLKIVKH